MRDKEFDKIIDEKDKKIYELEKENCNLKKRLLAYENAHTPPSLQKKKNRIPRESSGKLGAEKGHPKYERKEPEITSRHHHSLDTCPYCKSKSITIDDARRYIEEELPNLKRIDVIEHSIDCCICDNCGKRFEPKSDIPKERFGPNLRSHIALLRHEDRLPLRKVAATLERNFGFVITHVGIMKIIRQAAKRLDESYYEIVKRVRGAGVVYADETQYKLDGETWWLWTFVTQNDVLFVIRKSRSKKVIEEVLGKGFDGIIVCDGWRAYPNFAEVLQRCWAHILRESYHLLQNHNDFKNCHEKLNDLFQEIKSIRIKPPNEKERMRLAENMQERLFTLARSMGEKPYAKTLSTKIKNGINYWFTCVKHPNVEPTNNFAEQALRELIVQRKIMGGLRSEKGAKTLEIISTMIATWKKQGMPLLETMRNNIR